MAKDPALQRFLGLCRELPRLPVLAAVAAQLGAEDVPLLEHLDLSLPAIPAGWQRPELLSVVADATQPLEGRRTTGAFYTPPDLAERITQEVLSRAALSPTTLTVYDPACGGGAFLVAAVRWLIARGLPADQAVQQVHGTDLDPVALLVSEAALSLLSRQAKNLRQTDALQGESGRRFGAVIGNPPFLNQLQNRTRRTEANRFGLGGYADTAHLFLALAHELTDEQGAYGLIVPESLLASRGAQPLRALMQTGLSWIWRANAQVFNASVQVCAPVVTKQQAEKVERALGRDLADLGPVEMREAPTWSWLFADRIPAADHTSAGTVSDYATATADFRDQYYGLIPYVTDGGDGPRLMTAGLIDPARSLWGLRPTRFAKTVYARPTVDETGLARDPKLGPWAAARLVPKLLLSTQTRVLEVLADPEGALLPSIPTITVTCEPALVWHLAAALSSPVLTAYALTHYAGAALSQDAIKLSAKQVLTLPLPEPGSHWDDAAAAFQQASHATSQTEWRDGLTQAAQSSCLAYRISDAGPLIAWWQGRLPPYRGGHARPLTTSTTPAAPTS